LFKKTTLKKEYSYYCKSEIIIALKKNFGITALFCVITVFTLAQQANKENFRDQAIQNLIGVYYQSLGSQAELYNAPVYERHIPGFTSGHPFVYSDSFSVGTIAYNGLVYKKVPILYDIVRDELITRSPTGFALALIKPKVDSFSFDGHSYVKLKNDTSEAATQSYYERLSSGSIQLVAKRKKTVQVINGVTAVERRVYSEDRYYIHKGEGVFETIKKKNQLLGALKDKKNALQQFIKQNNLKFKENFEEDAARLVAYYNQLN
jgi:hypothetical protein